MIRNGYTISGNIGVSARLYHVLDASGSVVYEANHKRRAIEWCDLAPKGEVVAPEVSVEEVPDPSDESEVAVVAVDENDAVIGFGALSEYRDRAAYKTSVENSVYVRRNLSRSGIGKLILTNLLEQAADSGFHVVMARIEASSDASRGLHAACGFQLVGIEREIGRKFGKWRDVAIMQIVLHERQ